MKSTINTLPPPAFTPFEIVIRVETVEEAKALRLIAANPYDNSQYIVGASGAAARNGVEQITAQNALLSIRKALDTVSFGYQAG